MSCAVEVVSVLPQVCLRWGSFDFVSSLVPSELTALRMTRKL